MITATDRALGTVIGSAVGDALGAPFEFGPEGAFSARFPEPGQGGEMCGGGGWDPGEATDDTQMAVLVAESLLEHGGLELPDVFGRFRRWAVADPKDGSATRVRFEIRDGKKVRIAAKSGELIHG